MALPMILCKVSQTTIGRTPGFFDKGISRHTINGQRHSELVWTAAIRLAKLAMAAQRVFDELWNMVQSRLQLVASNPEGPALP